MNSSSDPVADQANGRDANGHFARGNPGGPGNPYYRRQAELKRMLLESVTDVDVKSVLNVLLGLARSGDLAAIKLFLEYTVGKPSREVDPDKEEQHEWQLQQQTPRLPQVMEVMAHSIETARANQVVRDMVPIVGACHLSTLSQTIRDGTAPADTNGGKRSSASARRMAAGVCPTVQTEDNGADEDAAWSDLLEEELTLTVATEEIGIPGSREAPGGKGQQAQAGASGPGKS